MYIVLADTHEGYTCLCKNADYSNNVTPLFTSVCDGVRNDDVG